MSKRNQRILLLHILLLAAFCLNHSNIQKTEPKIANYRFNNAESKLASGKVPDISEINIKMLEGIKGISTKKAISILDSLEDQPDKKLNEISWQKIKGVGAKTETKIRHYLNMARTSEKNTIDLTDQQFQY